MPRVDPFQPADLQGATERHERCGRPGSEWCDAHVVLLALREAEDERKNATERHEALLYQYRACHDEKAQLRGVVQGVADFLAELPPAVIARDIGLWNRVQKLRTSLGELLATTQGERDG